MVVQGLTKDGTDDVRSFDVAPGFSITEVDGHRGEAQTDHPQVQKPLRKLVSNVPVLQPRKIDVHPNDDLTLGPVLGKFVGTFRYVYLLQTLPNYS